MKTEINNPTTVAINQPWKTKNVVIYASAVATSGYQQKLTIVGPYKKGAKKPEAQTFSSTPQDGFGVQYCHFFTKEDDSEQFESYRFDVTIEWEKDGNWNKSDIITTSDSDISSKAIAVNILSNDDGKDHDYNDTYLTFTMFKQSND